MRETQLVGRLVADLPTNENVLTGAGDDCAVLRIPQGERILLLKTDAVVEGVHFDTDTAPGRIGHKALARCLSDFAAMGGIPDSCLVTLGLPDIGQADRAIASYEGIRDLARRHGVSVSGGETTRSPHAFFLSVTLTGYAGGEGPVLRRGGCPGDALFVTGTLGGSRSGHHLDFEPRIAEGRWLVENFRPHAMIDISDGLAGDLHHLLRASRVGALVESRFLPVSREAGRRYRQGVSGRTPLQAALHDGEDFELLFSLEAERSVALKDGWRERFPRTTLSLVGRLESEPGLRLRTDSGLLAIPDDAGHDHFGGS